MSDPIIDNQNAPVPDDAAGQDPETLILTPEEVRVLGCLMEKAVATPDYYPLTLNALTQACNQKSNRDPLMALNSSDVEHALDTLRYHHRLVTRVHTAGSRAHKYRHTLTDHFKLSPPQFAVLCELLLRGPETVGELRARAGRLFAFEDLAAVERTVTELIDFPGQALVVQLPREPGRREVRFMHLLGGPPAVSASLDDAADADDPAVAARSAPPTRMALLETEVKTLRRDLDQLRQEFEAFKQTLQ